MSTSPFFSVVIPVYNRPGEVEELLQSLVTQRFKNFEVILVEDGSSVSSKEVFERYADTLNLHYFYKPNSGPGPSRNFGFAQAKGKYLVVFDSDCIIPDHYLQTVLESLEKNGWDAWGGPDRGHENFTPTQQAMGYTMSSVFTTGGIRGGKNHVGDFQPRSFNMGISRKVFEATGGFKFDRFAEDIELSIRMKKAGFKIGLIADAYVFHKRRATFKQFFRQVANFGKGRVLINRAHPGAIKVTHWFPLLFSLGLVAALVLLLIVPWMGKIGLSLYALYFFLVLVDCLTKTRSVAVSLLSVPSAFVQLFGYGFGFFSELTGLLRAKN